MQKIQFNFILEIKIIKNNLQFPNFNGVIVALMKYIWIRFTAALFLTLWGFVMKDDKKQPAQNVREVRLVGVQDDDGYHLCLGFLKEVTPEGQVLFEDEGQKFITYGAYEVAIQDLEICLAHVKALRDAKRSELEGTKAVTN